MEFLKQMLEARISVNWGTVLIGWLGPGDMFQKLPNSSIIEYATGQVEIKSNSDGFQPVVLKLASLRESETELIHQYLEELALDSKSNEGTETRKWRWALLKQLLLSIGDDPLYGIMGLEEFWGRFSMIDGGPSLAPRFVHRILPTSYYSVANYRRIIEEHETWLANEEMALKES